jgi:dihydroorotase
MYDLLLAGGRVINPADDTDMIADVAFSNGKVAAVRPDVPRDSARVVRDVTGMIVAPGFIDMHTHVYWGGTSLGIEPDPASLRGGTTTLVDAGSAGPGNFAGFRRHVIEPSSVRILAYLNISFPGIFAFNQRMMVGECTDLRLLDVIECVRVIEENRDLIVGVKARVGRVASGSLGAIPLDLALEAAEHTGLPVMAHIDHPPPTYREVLERLRPGDILTHCFKPFPNAPLQGSGEIRPAVIAARQRGVIFDIGHGSSSFGFKTAREMLALGFTPDVISSDVHILCVDGPAHDLLTTMSKFYCLGLDIHHIIRATTVSPALALRRPDLGVLKEGGIGDATIIRINEGDHSYSDSSGERMHGRHRLKAAGLVINGRWLDTSAAPSMVANNV